MNSDEIDKIIADAVADSKTESRWHRPKSDRYKIRQVRALLNTVFMVGFVAAVIIYFVCPGQRTLFFCVGFGAMLVKIVEFILRFIF